MAENMNVASTNETAGDSALSYKLTLPKGSISINGHEYASPGSLTRLLCLKSSPNLWV